MSSNVRKLIGGIIARYQELCGIEIFSYIVLGNHMHLLIRAPLSNTDEFCENVNREIARRINWRCRREGSLWARRYDDEEVLSEDDLLTAFLYICTNSTHHGLVENPSEWPGLNSFKHVISEADRRFSFHHYSAKREEDRVTTHSLKISVLPQFASLTKPQRKKKIQSLLFEHAAQLAKERRERGQGFLGLRGVIDQVLGERPINSSRTPRPPCYTKCSKLRRQFRAEQRARLRAYARASFAFRLGDFKVKFPEFSFKPPLHKAPRLVPFKPIRSNSKKNED